MKWIKIKKQPLPDPKGFLNGFSIAAFHEFYGFGSLKVVHYFDDEFNKVSTWFYEKNDLMTSSIDSVTHYMEIPK